MPEYALTRNYLDLMVDLPWNTSSTGRTRSLSRSTSWEASSGPRSGLPRGFHNRPDLCLSLSLSSDRLDIGAARRLLDSDHYGLDKLKRRLLEYLAVRQLKTSLKVPADPLTRPASRNRK